MADNDFDMQVGKQLFGKPNRMLVGLWIRRFPTDVEFNASQFWEWCMSAKKTYAQANIDFQRFESLGMIELVSVDRAKWYRRLDVPMWEVFRVLDVVLNDEQSLGLSAEEIDKIVSDLRRMHHQTAPVVYDPMD